MKRMEQEGSVDRTVHSKTGDRDKADADKRDRNRDKAVGRSQGRRLRGRWIMACRVSGSEGDERGESCRSEYRDKGWGRQGRGPKIEDGGIHRWPKPCLSW